MWLLTFFLFLHFFAGGCLFVWATNIPIYCCCCHVSSVCVCVCVCMSECAPELVMWDVVFLSPSFLVPLGFPDHPPEPDSTLKCEFCGKVDVESKFRRSKRFCSMACAKRYNVGCTRRLALFKPKSKSFLYPNHKDQIFPCHVVRLFLC